jgi:DNA invertase Pin-like site-specific DNA recombinase
MNKPSQSKKVIGYIRVSTIDQDPEKNKADILKFANNNGFNGKVNFVTEKVSGATSWHNRKLSDLVEELSPNDIIIVPELSRLGRSLSDILELLKILSDKKVRVFSVKENFQLNGQDMQSKVMRTMLGLFAEIERDLISQRTKEGLEAAREKGVKLGRPKGPGKSKLDPHKDEILELLKNGSTKKFIAERFDTTPANLYNWLNKNGYNDIKPKP